MNKQAPTRPATFRAPAELFHADTCGPLEAAAQRGEVTLTALARGTYPGRPLPPDDLREVCSLGVWDAHRDQDWGLDWHRNEGLELTYVSAGRLPFAVDARSRTLEPGDLTITRPWQRHRVGNPHVTASKLTWLILDVGVRRPNQPWRWPKWVLLPQVDLHRLTLHLRQNEQPVWRADKELGRCFEAMGDALGRELTGANRTRLKVFINELLVALAELLERKRPQLDERLSSAERTVRLFLEELPRRIEEPWTLETMAKQCGLGRSFFSHYCKQIANRTPIEQLTHCRIDVAAGLLRAHPGRSITDIAFACGFQSSQYFATVFSRQKGCSPRAWRFGEAAHRPAGGRSLPPPVRT